MADDPRPVRLILADPPWTYTDASLNRGGAQRHYDTCSLVEIGAHINAWADPTGCALACWQTWPMQDEQDDMLRVFGWRKRTLLLIWVKMTSKGLAWGMGHYTRTNTEPVFLWTKGKDWPRVVARDVHQVIGAGREEHSRKPDEARTRIERLFGDVPRVELYRRGPAPTGWLAWGNEVTAAERGRKRVS